MPPAKTLNGHGAWQSVQVRLAQTLNIYTVAKLFYRDEYNTLSFRHREREEREASQPVSTLQSRCFALAASQCAGRRRERGVTHIRWLSPVGG